MAISLHYSHSFFFWANSTLMKGKVKKRRRRPTMAKMLLKTPTHMGSVKPLPEVQREFLQYLDSSTDHSNPHERFLPQISSKGYPSLEKFVEDIPTDLILQQQSTCAHHHHLQNNGLQVSLRPTSGMRYVSRANPSTKGTLILHNEESGRMILRLDNRLQGLIFSSLKWLSSWVTTFGRIFLRRNLHPFWWIFRRFAEETFPASQLQLERDYLRDLLPSVIHDTVVGPHRGIEGAWNSCYLDSLLFSMFYTSSIFDPILEGRSTDSAIAKQTRSILKNNIVSRLRTPPSYFCPSSETMKLRQALSPLNESLLGSFMDAEELLHILLQQCLEEKDFIKYAEDEDWGDFMHLTTVDLAHSSDVTTVQKCVENSFRLNNMKLKSVPSPAFIIGMPRSNRKLVHYKAVIPSLELDISNLLETEKCACGNEAIYESTTTDPRNLFCSTCSSSSTAPLTSRETMKLLSIICIRGVHFTAFSYCGKLKQWLYFDSMAGQSSEVTVVPKLPGWLRDLSEKSSWMLHHDELLHNNDMPAEVDRAIHDGHICIYEPILLHPVVEHDDMYSYT